MGRDWHFCKMVGFRIDPEDLEPLIVFAKEKRVTVSFLAKKMFLEGFARWRKGEFNPEITREGQRRYPASATAMRAGE